MRKILKKFLYKNGYTLTKVAKNPNLPIELSKEEYSIINYVRANNLSMCTEFNLMQTAVAAKYIAINKIQGDFVECGVYRGGNALIAASIFKLHNTKKRSIFLILSLV